jgi:Helix-turn-helix domain
MTFADMGPQARARYIAAIRAAAESAPPAQPEDIAMLRRILGPGIRAYIAAFNAGTPPPVPNPELWDALDTLAAADEAAVRRDLDETTAAIGERRLPVAGNDPRGSRRPDLPEPRRRPDDHREPAAGRADLRPCRFRRPPPSLACTPQEEAMPPGSRTPLAKPGEVAAYLQKPEKTLAEWRSRGIGPRYHTVGRDVRYRWEDVDDWLAAQANGAAAGRT